MDLAARRSLAHALLGCLLAVSVLFPGRAATAAGQFNDPAGVAVDGQGNVYVADTDNNRIQKLSVTGQ